MSYSEISAKTVRGRKAYTCEWCGEAILAKSEQLYRAYRFEGQFTTGRMHPECSEAMSKSRWDLVGDGWITGNPKRGETL